MCTYVHVEKHIKRKKETEETANTERENEDG